MQGLSQKDLRLLRDGQARLQSGDFEGAMLQMANVAKRTRHPEALHLFAFALLQNNRDDEALPDHGDLSRTRATPRAVLEQLWQLDRRHGAR